MSDSPDLPIIKCRITSRYYWRMICFALAFLGAAIWFGVHAYFVFPKDNDTARKHAWFEDKIQSTYYHHVVAGRLEEWYSTAEIRGWPAGKHGQHPEWEAFAAENGLPLVPPRYRSEAQIRAYHYSMLGSFLGMVIIGFITFSHGRMPLVADGKSFTTPNGVEIPFSSVRKVDRHLWKRQKLAGITYENQNGNLRKTEIDGLKFIEAEQILDRIIANFDGELIEADPGENGSAQGVSDTAQQAA